jgi:hypothetical protein
MVKLLAVCRGLLAIGRLLLMCGRFRASPSFWEDG